MLKLPFNSQSGLYYRVYVSNSWGIFWRQIKDESSSGIFGKLVLHKSDPDYAKTFAQRFTSMEDVKNFELSRKKHNETPTQIRII